MLGLRFVLCLGFVIGGYAGLCFVGYLLLCAAGQFKMLSTGIWYLPLDFTLKAIVGLSIWKIYAAGVGQALRLVIEIEYYGLLCLVILV